MRRIACVLGCLVLAGCEKPPAGRGLRVTVVLGENTHAVCVKVLVDGAAEHDSATVQVAGQSSFDVAVAQVREKVAAVWGSVASPPGLTGQSSMV